MSRAQRLLDLLQILRRHRRPVRGALLAAEVGISLRSLYRDIITLQGQGAPIEGEAGLGYVLRAGYTLPPLMFTREEIEALVLGSRWVAENGDAKLSFAAKDLLAKISAVLPEELRRDLDSSGLIPVPRRALRPTTFDLSAIRGAIRSESKVTIGYCAENGAVTQRVIWPFALGYFEETRIIVAWCESRQAYRHFRADRVSQLIVMPDRYPRRRETMIEHWKATELPKGNKN